MAKYLVTGGAGFIGSNLVEELLKRGERVRVLDNFITGRRQNLAPFLGDVELIEGDMTHYHVALKAVEGVDFVLHQAALPSVPRSIADPLTSNLINVNGTLNILHAAVEKKATRVIYASSSSVYGDSPVSPKTETLPPAPKSPYAVSKIAGEYYCRVFTQVYGLETVSLRYFNVFGPRQDPASPYSAVIPKFLRAMLRGERPVIYGDGSQSRDFTFVANNVEANLLACAASGVAGEVFNIACGTNFTLLELVAALNRILGTSSEPILSADRPGDIKHSLADISAARKRLGYQPRVSFEEGLKRLVENFER
ncbi:MAG: SDR family oxidoreductase [Bacteroidia bacterium]|nr:SDR family oxidoreductase [Bacteroidia bacterium]MDW8333068.1 SDR family oxidoreductase [Bacteroidia bacterium]